jgi:hypothetical protein
MYAQTAQPLWVDLSTIDAGKPLTNVLPRTGRFFVAVVNWLPNPDYKYSILIHISARPIPPITLPTFAQSASVILDSLVIADSLAGASEMAERTPSAACITMTQDTTALLGLGDEKDVPKALAKAAKDTMGGGTSTCPSTAMNLRGLMLATQVQSTENPVITPGYDLSVTIIRSGKTPSDTKSWSLTYTGTDRGSWVTTYGFAYIVDAFSQDESYTAKQIGTTATYRITKDAHRGAMNYVPTIFFSWQPSKANMSGDLSWVVSGGLGFDLSNPVVELAPLGFSWNRNLTLHLGVAVAKLGKLQGQYSPNDTIMTNLKPDQLTHSVYALNPFIALSFTFNKSPFGGGGTSQEPSGAASVTPTTPMPKPDSGKPALPAAPVTKSDSLKKVTPPHQRRGRTLQHPGFVEGSVAGVFRLPLFCPEFRRAVSLFR